MRCLVCHKRVPRLRAWRTKSEFCSDAHAETYRKLTLARLLDERSPASAADLPLPTHEVLAEEQAPSSVGAPAATETSVEPIRQPDPAYPAAAGPVLTDPLRKAYARQEEGRVGELEREAAEEARMLAEERVSASQDPGDVLIPSFSEPEGTEGVKGADALDRLLSPSNEASAEAPPTTVDVQLGQSEDLRDEIAAIRGEQEESGVLEAPESKQGGEASPVPIEQVEGVTEPPSDILHLLGIPEQDEAEAREPEPVEKDSDLLAHSNLNPESSQVQDEQPIDEEALISPVTQSLEEGEVKGQVSTDKADDSLDALLDILGRPTSSDTGLEPGSPEPDQPAEADSESLWSPGDCRPFTELVSIDELVDFAPDRDPDVQGTPRLRSGHLEAGTSEPEDALGVERSPVVPDPPQALGADSSFGSVSRAPLTHPETFEVVEGSSSSHEAYGELQAGAPRATAPVTPQQAASLTLGSPGLRRNRLVTLWPAAAEGAKQPSEVVDFELRSHPYRCLPAEGSRVASLYLAPGSAFLIRPSPQATGGLRRISLELSPAIADEQGRRPVYSEVAAAEKPPAIRTAFGRTPVPIPLSAARQATVSTRELLPESADLSLDRGTSNSSDEESADAFGPQWTASLTLSRRAIKLKTSYRETLWLPGIACAEPTTQEGVPEFTQEPRYGTALTTPEPMISGLAKPIASTFSAATLGSVVLEPQDLPLSEPVDLAEAVGTYELGTAADLTEVFPESIRWISLGPSLVAKDTFSETAPEAKDGLPLTFAPEARCDARQFAAGAEWQSTLRQTQRPIPFAWYVIPADYLTTALPKPLEETLEGRTELRAEVIVSKVECRLPNIGELRYRLSGCFPAHFEHLASEDSWSVHLDLPEATVENAYRAEAEVISKSTMDDVRSWIPPEVRVPVEELLQFNSGFELVGEILPSSVFEVGVEVLGTEGPVRLRAGSQAGGTAPGNGEGPDVESTELVGPLMRVRCPSDLEFWDFS